MNGHPSSARNPVSCANRIVLVAMAVLIPAEAYIQFVSAFSGDRNWLLYAVRMMLAGKKLYADIVEVNPPLILWLYMAPVEFARWLSLPAAQVLAAFGLALAGLSAWMSLRLLAPHPALARRERHLFALLIFGVFITISPAYFADRESLLLMFIFPYLMRWIPSLSRLPVPLKLRLAAGAMAGIGFCIKPHAMIVFAALQAIYILRERSARILLSLENGLVYLAAVAYVAAIAAFCPDYVRVVLPMALATYSAYSMRSGGLLFCAQALLISGVTFADFRVRDASPYRRDIYYLLGICGAFLLYALANNGWGYTYSPLVEMLLITTGLVGFEFRFLRQQAQGRGENSRRFLFGLRACAVNLAANAALCVLFPLYVVLFYCHAQLACDERGRELTAAVSSAGSFGTLALVDFDTWPRLADATGAAWQTRFNNLWMLHGFMGGNTAFTRKHQAVAAYAADALAQDMERGKPELMIADNVNQFTHRRVDIAGFLSGFPSFRAAWAHYRFEKGMTHCDSDRAHDAVFAGRHCDYSLYRRIP